MLMEKNVLEALTHVMDPELHKSVVELNMVRNIQIDGDQIRLEIILTIQGCPLKVKIKEDVVQALKALGASVVEVIFGTMSAEERAELTAKLRGPQMDQQEATVSPLLDPNSKVTFISVSSGKGGVGKSTVTCNLAVSLARRGKKVAIIDADIYGFSIPDMMGITQKPTVIDQMILPVTNHDVKVMSMGFFVKDNEAVVWRGPMLGKALTTFFNQVYWGELDYVLLDLPPGTGDIPLSIHRMIPQSKQIVVTTPHPTASNIAYRAGAMAKKANHEILGVIENMSYMEDEKGQKQHLFGKGGGEKLAQYLDTEVIGFIPFFSLDPDAESHPLSIYPPGSKNSDIYMHIAKEIEEKVKVVSPFYQEAKV
ncbi:Mrp/NBP35 family ATP-binding protein [Ammoniphilus sp. 3BR4]|uniref:Mrp/NBP35 family ATP-binding protein n=1 Tax=Ammoniphilus sp. 3BR4 TaxID=3158265 RepID=UPI00346611C1